MRSTPNHINGSNFPFAAITLTNSKCQPPSTQYANVRKLHQWFNNTNGSAQKSIQHLIIIVDLVYIFPFVTSQTSYIDHLHMMIPLCSLAQQAMPSCMNNNYKCLAQNVTCPYIILDYKIS